jgi:site-specific recombinase XerC
MGGYSSETAYPTPVIETVRTFYRRTEKYRHSANTIGGYTILLKKIIRRAINQGTLLRDPFADYRPEQPPQKCRHMTADELERLMATRIASKSLCHTRDMFVFATFTGISYADLCNLSISNISKSSNGTMVRFISKGRRPEAKCPRPPVGYSETDYREYKPERKGDKIFNMVGYSSTAANLKKVAKLCAVLLGI